MLNNLNETDCSACNEYQRHNVSQYCPLHGKLQADDTHCELCGGDITVIHENNGFNEPDPTHIDVTLLCKNCD